jgi:hypothetical protein
MNLFQQGVQKLRQLLRTQKKKYPERLASAGRQATANQDRL